MIMNFYISLVFLNINYVLSSKVLRPRGVSLAMSSLYDPAKHFSCFDGSATVPFNYVNDDYCDCNDGSDEPGTSACLNGSFHCNNIGHISLDISSSYVNDGVCDCCDASDEYASKADCLNICQELGEAARIEAKRKAQIQQEGYNMRQKMAEEGVNIKKEKQARILDLQNEKEKAEKEYEEKKALKEEAEIPEKEALEKYKAIEEELKAKKEEENKLKERQEAEVAFIELDVDGDGHITISEIQSKPVFDTNKDGEVSEEEARFYINQKDSIDREFFISSGWTFIKPTYRYGKRMFQPPETVEATEDQLNVPNEQPQDQTDDVHNEDDSNFEDYDENSNDNGEMDYAEEVDDPEVTRMKEEAESDTQQTEEEEEEAIKYDDETQQLVDIANAAREEFNAIDQHYKDLIKEIENLKSDIEKDLGPNEEFRILEGKCFEFNDREYTYKLCPFNSAIQSPRSGHGETRLGSWGIWAGPPDNLYSVMKYTNGQACWNGPQRSAEVKIVCDIENKIVSVSEPNRCEYQFIFTTPALCTQMDDSQKLHQHTEL